MHLTLDILPQTFAIYRLPPNAPLPSWAQTGSFWSITRTVDELSLVCEQHVMVEQALLTAEGRVERDWRCYQVRGPLAFTLTGVAAALTQPLADAEISVFVLSTFDTDYVLVKAADLPRATEVLVGAGHEVVV